MSILYVIKRKKPVAIVGLVLTVILAVRVMAAEHHPFKAVTVIGTSVVQGEDVASARERSISNGLNTAVETALLRELPPDYLLKYFPMISRMLSGQSDVYIQEYTVLTEARTGKTYRVLLKATIAVAVLQEQLANAGVDLKQKELPRVLFLIAEQKIEDTALQYWWGRGTGYFENFSEQALAKTLRGKGFAVIDPTVAAQGLELDTEYRKLQLSDQEIRNLGRNLKADVVVVGRAGAQIAQNIMGSDTRSFKGTVSVRAIRLDTGQTVADLTQNAVTVNTDEIKGGHDVLAAAGSLLGETLAVQISSAWMKEVSAPTMVQLVVGGTGKLKNFETFRKALESLSGVNEIQIQEMKPNEMLMVVDYQHNARALASALMLKTFDAFGLNIFEILEDQLRLELVPR